MGERKQCQPRPIGVGEKYGRLTVQTLLPDRRVRCECECGGFWIGSKYDVLDGKVVSCGCRHTEVLIARNTVHGCAHRSGKSAEYITWSGMRRRCYNENDSHYHMYGLRGIKICDRWLGEHGFENFLSDMGEKPSPEHSIDRIDTNGNYEPGNCRWSTVQEQGQNTRRTILTVDDVVAIRTTAPWTRKTRSELAKRFGVSVSTIQFVKDRRTWKNVP